MLQIMLFIKAYFESSSVILSIDIRIYSIVFVVSYAICVRRLNPRGDWRSK